MTEVVIKRLSTAPADWPDGENLILEWLKQAFPVELPDDSHIGDETPIDLQDHFPFVTVALIGGNDDQITDFGAYDVEVFAATRAAAFDLAERIRTAFIGYPHRVDGIGVIDTVYTEQKPRRLPWDEENTRRFGATYRVSFRR